MIRDALLFITPNTKYPDQSIGTVWNVTVQVFLEVADPWEAGTLRLEIATKNGSAFIEKDLVLKHKEEVISLSVSVTVSSRNFHATEVLKIGAVSSETSVPGRQG